MSHAKDLRNWETGIRRLAVNINMSLLELGLNSYGNYGYGKYLSVKSVGSIKIII